MSRPARKFVLISTDKYMTKIELYNKVQSSDIGRRMANGVFWSFFGTSVAKAIVLIGGIICARILGKEEYGQFGMIRATINMFVVFGIAGLGLTATKFISEYKANQKHKIPSIYILTNGFAVITGTIITILILILASTIAENNLHSPQLLDGLKLGALILFFTVLNGAQNGTLVGLEDFKSVALNTFYGSLAEFALMVLGAYYYGVNGAILGYGLGFIVLFVCNYYSIRRNFDFLDLKIAFSEFNKGDLKLLYKFSIPAALSSLMVGPVYWIIRSMLVRECGFGELAVYEVAEQWRVIILFIPSSISQIVLPILSSIVNDDSKKFWKTLNLNLVLNVSITLMLTLILCFCGSFVVGLYGDEFTDSTALVILTASTIFSSIANVIGISIQSRNKVWVGFSFNVCWALMVILFSHFFISKGLGATGLAIAILCSYIVHSTAQFIYLRILIN